MSVSAVTAGVLDASRHRDKEQPFRIAVVGCGPRGLYCLQSLLEELRDRPCQLPIEISVFEPCDFPGAGSVYDPRQPHFLRMNYAAKYIDAWPRNGNAGDSEGGVHRFSLLDWIPRRRDFQISPNGFLPRAIVGEYLHECFRIVVAQISKLAAVATFPVRIDCIQPTEEGRWRLGTDTSSVDYDQVAITVGHEGWRPALDIAAVSAPRYVPAFPIEQLDQSRILPGSTVGVRGFGLTWIDAALAMTKGRGGRFEVADNHWTYRRCGLEPESLLPFSRTGRPMLAKPDESQFPQPEDDALWEQGRATIASSERLASSSDLDIHLWRTVTTSAASALSQLRPIARRQVKANHINAWFDRWSKSTMEPGPLLCTMRRSFAVATGHAEPDIAWALGAAWRNLYPAIVSAVSHGGLAANAWPRFSRIAREMERIAFGPPAETLGQVLALIEAGIVNLKFIASSSNCEPSTTRPITIFQGGRTVTLDHLVDAVLPAPDHIRVGGPMDSLLNAGLVQKSPGAVGINVDQAGCPLLADGSKVKGLAVFGRSTEGVVLGNDTLSRQLHDHPRRWASTVVQRARSLGQKRKP